MNGQPYDNDLGFQSSGYLAPGHRIGVYEVQGPPIRGGFASVFRCKSTLDGTTVAVKVLNELQMGSVHAVARFEQEVAVIRSIEHPNIVRVFEYGLLPDGRPYYTMEWLDGTPLRQELHKRGPLLPAEAMPIVEQIGAALSAAHAAGVVHRDLTPDNIMAIPSNDGMRIKLLDFGISRVIGRGDAHARLTTAGICLGSVHYMSPEQVLCDDIDIRTDIYALGVLLFRMVTGSLPFHAPEATSVQMMHLDQPPPRAGELAPTAIPWDETIRQCMAKTPSERPQSVAEVLGALRDALSKHSQPAERVIVHIEFHGAASADWHTREAALDAVAATLFAAGWEIILEADDAIIAQTESPLDGPFAATRQELLVRTAHRVARAAKTPPITPQVWVRLASSPASSSSSSPSQPGVYIARALLPETLDSADGADETGEFVFQPLRERPLSG